MHARRMNRGAHSPGLLRNYVSRTHVYVCAVGQGENGKSLPRRPPLRVSGEEEGASEKNAGRFTRARATKSRRRWCSGSLSLLSKSLYSLVPCEINVNSSGESYIDVSVERSAKYR